MKLRAGQTLYSSADATTVVVIRAPDSDVAITCGGAEMLDAPPASPSESTAADGDGTQLGKRYADETLGIELLCTKAGSAPLAVNGAALGLKEAKPLPASD